jgi:hypothetical protein
MCSNIFYLEIKVLLLTAFLIYTVSLRDTHGISIFSLIYIYIFINRYIGNINIRIGNALVNNWYFNNKTYLKRLISKNNDIDF